MVEFNFKYKGKSFSIDAEKCDNYFSRVRGLMFRRKPTPLLFIFNGKTRQSIHSFFCVPFIAIWFNEDEIIDVKLVKPWKTSVFPSGKFDKLLEIPLDNKNFERFKVLIQK